MPMIQTGRRAPVLLKEAALEGPKQEERARRAAEQPIVGGLPDLPGLPAALMISPDFEKSIHRLVNFLLVKPYIGATITRAERELIATAVSSGNDCVYCMDGHGAVASTLLQRDGLNREAADTLMEAVKCERDSAIPGKLRELIHVASVV